MREVGEQFDSHLIVSLDVLFLYLFDFPLVLGGLLFVEVACQGEQKEEDEQDIDGLGPPGGPDGGMDGDVDCGLHRAPDSFVVARLDTEDVFAGRQVGVDDFVVFDVMPLFVEAFQLIGVFVALGGDEVEHRIFDADGRVVVREVYSAVVVEVVDFDMAGGML